MKPKVSIITATHYRPDFLRRCIIAVQNQKMKEHEHLIIADHCPFAEKVYNQFKEDKRIRFYHTDGEPIKNVGATSKNKGIKLAKTNYICYCDDDNILLPNHTTALYNALNNSNYKIAFTYAYIMRFSSINNHKYLLNRELYDITKVSNISYDDMLCCMHTKNTILKIDGWKTWEELNNPAEDTDVIEKFKKYYKIKFLEDRTCIYYVHGGVRKENSYSFKKEYQDILRNMPKNQTYAYPDLAFKKHDLNFKNSLKQLLKLRKNEKKDNYNR